MSFQQITIFGTSADISLLSDIFFELGALSTTIEDEFANTNKEQPIFNEPTLNSSSNITLWEHSKLTILFDDIVDILPIIKQANAVFESTFEYTITKINDQNWVALTQSQFHPIKISEKLYIVPSWHKPPNPKAINIILDPGLAFGTGTHPTTFMCLKWISQHANKYTSMLDYGCGSGILAVSGKKMGISDVYGIDIDPQAIESSTYNAKNNQVSVSWYLAQNNEINTIKCDLVVANILSIPLKTLAPLLANHTHHTLILSGILDEQYEELKTIYSAWFDVVKRDTLDGWVLIECNKPHAK